MIFKKLLSYSVFAMLLLSIPSWANTIDTANTIRVGSSTIDALSSGETTKYYQFTITEPSYVSVNFAHASTGYGGTQWQTSVQSADGVTTYLATNISGVTTNTRKSVG